MKPATTRPYWPAVCVAAFDPDNLPRVLASMGFDRYCGTATRGEIAWWRPAYATVAPDTFRAYGERSATYLANRRADLATLNRALRDSPVHLLALSGQIVLVDEFAGEGEWRTASGANRGDDLISLGMWRWSCRYGQAAYRIARAIGMQVIPTVTVETRQRIAA